MEEDGDGEDDGSDTTQKQGKRQVNEFTPIESEDGLIENYLPLLEPFELSIMWC